MRILPYRPSAALALVALVAVPLAGCARTATTKGDVPYVARDVGTLYTAAKSRLDQNRYKEAAILFDEVERQHPYSIWARRAQLMSAFSYYLARDYTPAIQSAQRFISVHPGNRDAPYAYYLVALSYYEQIQDVTRDQKITVQALNALGELTRRYPDTRYASDARLKIDLVNDHLAGKEMEIGRFYETRGQWLAASMRFRSVIDTYQTTTHAPEALMRLTETYLALGVPTEAQKAAAVLGRNYPGSDWYQQAYKLMEKHPVQLAALVQPGQVVTRADAPKGPSGEPTGKPRKASEAAPATTGTEPANAPAVPPSTVGTGAGAAPLPSGDTPR
ncbi:outer membrane protein assembly factor BamD [Sphingomonas metalli]|uniref:Outer membrane protein assembly factor BamD n=1 Tax=Sphingomonas metalli TaxID=1779358 RepID=A0A916T088_9SPHN|nr:outer membrane protein assembly factor BamD [Sphingomonas metalli]GGB26218.1 outer membrane protein assembly factor BamD [Sphingomonas metalli]